MGNGPHSLTDSQEKSTKKKRKRCGECTGCSRLAVIICHWSSGWSLVYSGREFRLVMAGCQEKASMSLSLVSRKLALTSHVFETHRYLLPTVESRLAIGQEKVSPCLQLIKRKLQAS